MYLRDLLDPERYVFMQWKNNLNIDRNSSWTLLLEFYVLWYIRIKC